MTKAETGEVSHVLFFEVAILFSRLDRTAERRAGIYIQHILRFTEESLWTKPDAACWPRNGMQPRRLSGPSSRTRLRWAEGVQQVAAPFEAFRSAFEIILLQCTEARCI